MHEKHDRTAESHAGVLGHKNNFFSSFTYTGEGGVILCLRNTIEQLNHMLGFLERRRIFFLLLYDGGSYIMPEKHDLTDESHAGFLEEEELFFFFYIHRMGELQLCKSSSYLCWRA